MGSDCCSKHGGCPRDKLVSTSAARGLKDEEILVLLRRQRSATFFTRDADFYQPALRHRKWLPSFDASCAIPTLIPKPGE